MIKSIVRIRAATIIINTTTSMIMTKEKKGETIIAQLLRKKITDVSMIKTTVRKRTATIIIKNTTIMDMTREAIAPLSYIFQVMSS